MMCNKTADVAPKEEVINTFLNELKTWATRASTILEVNVPLIFALSITNRTVFDLKIFNSSNSELNDFGYIFQIQMI